MADPEPKADDVFDVDRVLRLVEMMKKHDLTEINLRQSEQKIQLKRETAQPQVVGYAAPPAPQPLPTAAPAPAAPAATDSGSAAAADDPNIHVMKSPMVGTYYARANPEAEAFVKVGDRVSTDMTICIIEAMKVFNEMNPDVAGEVVAILVENEDPVEYGQPLFKIDTSK
jgi:acetyl-CoA carboxylase biotin carboxyl carrier protein